MPKTPNPSKSNITGAPICPYQPPGGALGCVHPIQLLGGDPVPIYPNQPGPPDLSNQITHQGALWGLSTQICRQGALRGLSTQIGHQEALRGLST